MESTVKFEHSPAESFLSISTEYPSLFDVQIIDETLSQPAVAAGKPRLCPLPSITESPDPPSSPLLSLSADDKATKKRKSWGQVLPEPKTNLPPRKRAKTEDEKEQRRVERVLRNRRAAQSSRERKRLEVEALEIRNKELEAALESVKQANLMLINELNKFRMGSTVSSSPMDVFRGNSLTLSQELFGSHSSQCPSVDDSDAGSAIKSGRGLSPHSNPTVNPASLSPALSTASAAVAVNIKNEHEHEHEHENESLSAETEAKTAAFPGLTQHPAAMLFDLQCHSPEGMPSTCAVSQTNPSTYLQLFLRLQWLQIFAATLTATCRRPLAQIAISLNAGRSLHPTPAILKTIIWLVTRPASVSTFPTLSTTKSTARRQTSMNKSLQAMVLAQTRSTLRLSLLQKLLTCSPNLARPLMDATLEVLRLVSKERIGGNLWSDIKATRDKFPGCLPTRMTRGKMPSREVLLTLLWTIRVENRKMQRRLFDTPIMKPESIRSRADRHLL